MEAAANGSGSTSNEGTTSRVQWAGTLGPAEGTAQVRRRRKVTTALSHRSVEEEEEEEEQVQESDHCHRYLPNAFPLDYFYLPSLRTVSS